MEVRKYSKKNDSEAASKPKLRFSTAFKTISKQSTSKTLKNPPRKLEGHPSPQSKVQRWDRGQAHSAASCSQRSNTDTLFVKKGKRKLFKDKGSKIKKAFLKGYFFTIKIIE